MTLTRAFNPRYMVVAAVLAVALAFIAKLGALLQTIPGPVMGDYDATVRFYRGHRDEYVGACRAFINRPA